MQRLLAVAALGFLPAAAAGLYTPPPGDYAPQWAPDGSRIYFFTTRGGSAIASASPDGSGEKRLVEEVAGAYALAPNGALLTYTRTTDLRVAASDGSGSRTLATGNTPAWSRDSRRIAFQQGDSLYVVGADGSAPATLLTPGSHAAWSPVADRIAYDRLVGGNNLDVHVIGADGSADVNLTAGDDLANIRPKWSPDGRLIAFLTSTGATVRAEVVEPSGRGRRTLPVDVPITNGVFTWSPTGELVVGTGKGVVALNVATGKKRRLAVPAEPVWSRDGSRLAYADGGECRDRLGIYVGKSDTKPAARVTNDCRIFGTAGNDDLEGTPLADVLLGLGGNDRLHAVDEGYVGDTLIGGAGDDVLVGDYRSDTLEGGAGADRLAGGPSADVLSGGPGRDVIDGQGGRDIVYARDGFRDAVVCGTNTPGTPERDEVFADRVDRVARDCEVVHRG